MLKIELPEAVRMRPSEALRLNAWAGGAVLASVLSRWTLTAQPDWPDGIRILISLSALIPGLLWFRTILRWMRGLDELQRRIQFEAWFFSAIGTIFFITALDLVVAAGLFSWNRIAHGLGWEGTFALMFLLYCVGCSSSNRHYR